MAFALPTGRVPHATVPAGLAAAADSALGSSRFTRRYWGNPGWFLFLRLVICLNSAGNLVRSEVGCVMSHRTGAAPPRRPPRAPRARSESSRTRGERAERALRRPRGLARSRAHYGAGGSRRQDCGGETEASRAAGAVTPGRPEARRRPRLSCRPTLRRAWPREDPRPPCAFETSMLGVFCNSHEFARLAALFIDARAE